MVLPVCRAFPCSHRGLGAASNVASCPALLKTSDSCIRWTHVLWSAQYQTLAGLWLTADFQQLTVIHSPIQLKPCPWQWEVTVRARTVWFDQHEFTTALTLQKDLKTGIHCSNIHLSYIALPKLYELLKMQIRIMVIEWLWLTWKRFAHQYNGAQCLVCSIPQCLACSISLSKRKFTHQVIHLKISKKLLVKYYLMIM